VSFGTVQMRPETLIVGRHFNVSESSGDTTYLAKSTWERDGKVTGEFLVTRHAKTTTHNLRESEKLDSAESEVRDRLLKRTEAMSRESRFVIEFTERDETLTAAGDVVDNHTWRATRLTVGSKGSTREYAALADVPDPQRSRLENHLRHEGLAYVSVFKYAGEHGRLPPLDWATIVAFVAIAGAGGMTNTMFSNYARDKGWGMGCHVGAIPSACGGVTVALSHTGSVFPLDDVNRSRWRGWLQHVRRDQAIWILASIIGMALPCMMSLEFIRNATVHGDRVAAMSAEGIASRYPSFAAGFWFLTLFCGFLVLAPGQVSSGDQISRRWTDMIWTASPRAQRLGEVRYVYYGILAAYCVCGLLILTIFPAVQIARIAAVLQNIALGSTALMSLYVNRKLLPQELHPGWPHQLGTVLCGVFFLSISLALLFI